MLLKELIRFSTHRTLCCYMILSIWIFLLIAGMYKYMGGNNVGSLGNNMQLFNAKPALYSSSMGAADLASNERDSLALHQYKTRCNPFHKLTRHEDGGMLEGWKLSGVLLVIRHGDRGPMSHVRGVSDCGVLRDALVDRYRSYLHNSTSSSSGANRMYWSKVGPFHGFPLLPSADSQCLLGQLTYKGIAQLLHLGELLYQIYAHPLGLLFKQGPSKSIYDSTPNSFLNSDEVVVYSTRYRRTFQSAMALLYAFLPPDKYSALNVHESHSMAFCFTDCACAQAEALRRQLNALNSRQLKRHTAVLKAMERIGETLLQHIPNGINDPNEVVDALLMILCHDADLPCRSIASANATVSSGPVVNSLDISDIINIDIDQEDSLAANLVDMNGAAVGEMDALDREKSAVNNGDTSTSQQCVQLDDVNMLMDYVNRQSVQEVHHEFYKRVGLMRAYGMIRHIVSHMLKMISGDRTKFVLYSGHDWSLQYLTSALGIKLENTFVPYASRLSIEVYKSEAHTEYYFRMVFNGRDVTQQIDFCEGGKSLRVTRDSRGHKADLCPIENIIRFLHEDYFMPMNATNFKEACALNSKTDTF